MYQVRFNVGMKGRRRGDIGWLTEAEYRQVRPFVTLLAAPEPQPEPEEEVVDDGVLWSEPSESVDSSEPDPAWDFDSWDDGEEGESD